PAIRYWTAGSAQGSHDRAHTLDEFAHLGGILDSLALLHPAADIHGERANLRNRLLHVLRSQPAGENHRFRQSVRDQRPVEHLARAARHTGHEGIQQDRAGPCVACCLGLDVLAGFHPQGLEPGTAMPLTFGRRFVAMELQDVQGHRIEDFTDLTTAGIDEQPNRSDERRERSNDLAGLLYSHGPGTLGIEHQADRIRTGFGCDKCVFDTGNPAYLATNDRQLIAYLLERQRMVTKATQPASAGTRTWPTPTAYQIRRVDGRSHPRGPR